LARGLLLLLLAGVVVGGVFGYRALTRPPEQTYRTVKLDRGGIVAQVNATGTLSAHVTVQVGAQVSGRIAELDADFNSSVKKGQVIARLDPELFKAALAQSHANTIQASGVLAQAKATLDKDKKVSERAKQLHDEGLMSQQDFDNAMSQIAIDQAAVAAQAGQVEQSRAQERQGEINLAYCTIYSPIDGTVISRSVDVGQTVAASLQAPVLFTIAEDLHKMQVDTNVTEGDVGKLKDKMRATFMVDAYPNERFVGTIQQIRNAATTVQNVVTYDAVIEVENTELKLRPGMTANAKITYDRREDALRVPNAALRFHPPPALAASASAALAAVPPPVTSSSASPGEHARHHGASSAAPEGSASPRPHRGHGAPADPTVKVIWVMRGAQPVPVVVHVGLTDGTNTEVVSGEVQEGDEVVLELLSGDEPAHTGHAPSGNQPPRMRL